MHETCMMNILFLCSYFFLKYPTDVSLIHTQKSLLAAQWLSGRALDSRPKGHGFEPHRHHCVVSLSNPCLVLIQPRETRPNITEKIVDSDVKSKIKQTKSYWFLMRDVLECTKDICKSAEKILFLFTKNLQMQC